MTSEPDPRINRRVAEWLMRLSRNGKRTIVFAVDAALCFVTVTIAYYLRLGVWNYPRDLQWLSYLGALLLALPVFASFSLYRAVFRFVGWGALGSVVRACAVYGLLYASIFTFIGIETIPRTVGLIQPILLFIAVGSSRSLAHYWLGVRATREIRLSQRRRVLIFGAGAAGRQLAAALATSDDMQVVAFVDDDPSLQGNDLNGKYIHPTADLGKLIERLAISDVLLALPSATRRRRNEILEALRGSSATIRTLPGVTDIAQGKVTLNDLRELDIEDLLARDTVPPNRLLLARNISGKRVLVTGAGGSIGSELCRQVLALEPEVLLLVEASEFNLYAIHSELAEHGRQSDIEPTRIVPLLASVQDQPRMDAILAAWRPTTLYHAAAYKHVPLVEHNPTEGLRNNVLGTLVTAQAAIRHDVTDFVLISTDKAVRPTNVMGTSKRLAEMVLQAFAHSKPETRFTIVRFGNVLGSSGSVVPLFRSQIRRGGPVTITHEEITRYFMTIPEAAQLVIQAGAMGEGGEVFVLDMGGPVRIVDMAKRMIELSGLSVRDATNPDGDIEIAVVGLRPGEKLYEELLIGDNPEPTSHPRIMKANETFIPWPQLSEELEKLRAGMDRHDVEWVREHLRELVPEFVPDGAVVDWVHLQQASG